MRSQSFSVDGSFKFLNEEKFLSEIGWDGAECGKLWRYNQHYFDDLNSFGADQRYDFHRQLMFDWIDKNKAGSGTGWEPYPTSLRIVNWIKWSFAGHTLPDECLQSLTIQTRWLSKNIEWHILGNHLFANAKALVFAGLFFDGEEPRRWLDTGLEILINEVSEQVLPDGGHFERSPMYHSIFLEDMLDIINLFEAFPNVTISDQLKLFRKIASRMLTWLENMCHPDQEIAFFNDAAIGIAPTPKALRSYARRLNFSTHRGTSDKEELFMIHHSDSGYIHVGNSDLSLFLDVAPVGPDYLPGHAHADTLTFEMSLFGKRFLVNGGTSQYGTGLIRLQERSTESHNTVVVNGHNSSEVWSGFRVARRAKPFGLALSKNSTSIIVNCAHDGYQRLPGCPVHWRSWTFTDGGLLIEDKVEGVFRTAIAYFHFHPEVEVVRSSEFGWTLGLKGCNRKIRMNVPKGSPRVTHSVHSPEFGLRLSTQCLVVEFEQKNEIAVEVTWKSDD